MNAIELQPILTDVVETVGAVLVTSVAALLPKMLDWLHVSKTSALRNTVESIVDNGITFAIQKAQAEASAHSTIQVSSTALAVAVQYVLNKAPGSLKALGIDITTASGQQHIADMVAARIRPVIAQLTNSAPTLTTAVAVDTSPAGLAALGAAAAIDKA